VPDFVEHLKVGEMALAVYAMDPPVVADRHRVVNNVFVAVGEPDNQRAVSRRSGYLLQGGPAISDETGLENKVL
jgi:hypothetical protein